MNAARLDKSERLQRVAQVLRDGFKHSTRDIMREANVCAVNSCIAEMRANGLAITCQRIAGNFYYQLCK